MEINVICDYCMDADLGYIDKIKLQAKFFEGKWYFTIRGSFLPVRQIVQDLQDYKIILRSEDNINIGETKLISIGVSEKMLFSLISYLQHLEELSYSEA